MNFFDRLANRLGIEERFTDAAGEVRETPVETKRALLAAMGIQADGETQAECALAALQRQDWSRSLPHVRVAACGAVSVEAMVPAGTREFRWTLFPEPGGEQAGSAACGELTRIESLDLDGRKLERHRVALPAGLPLGYHRLRSELDSAVCLLIVTPGSCWLPASVKRGKRLRGIAVQLYLLRSAGNWGIGLHLYPSPEGPAEARRERERDRWELLLALCEEQLLPEGGQVQIETLTAAVHAFLARTRAWFAMAQLDDLTAETEPVNVPATSGEYPNWRRRGSRTLEELYTDPRLRVLARIFHAEGRGSEAPAAETSE